MKAQRGASANAPKICIRAAGPPVEEPIATSFGAETGSASLRRAIRGMALSRSRTFSMRSSRIEWTLRMQLLLDRRRAPAPREAWAWR